MLYHVVSFYWWDESELEFQSNSIPTRLPFYWLHYLTSSIVLNCTAWWRALPDASASGTAFALWQSLWGHQTLWPNQPRCSLWPLEPHRQRKIKRKQMLSSPNSLGVVKDGECVSGQCKHFNATATLPEGFQTIFPTTQIPSVTSSMQLFFPPLLPTIRPRTLHELHVRRPGRARVAGFFASPFGTRRGANVTGQAYSGLQNLTKNIKDFFKSKYCLFVCSPVESTWASWCWMLIMDARGCSWSRGISF